MRMGSLFSGIGGFDLGLETAGMSCAWQVEIDRHCAMVLSEHWPNVERFRDVRECGSANLAPVDLVCGGFPCQDLSVAGKRAGLAGGRSGLWFEFHRVLAELRPRWCLIENVPGLLSSNGGRDFAILLRGLEQLGYHAAWRILDAQYFGVAQRRRRVFIVGSLGDYGCLQVLFESEGLCGDPPPRREAGQAIAGTLGGGSGSGGIRNDIDSSGAFVFESRCARNDRGGPDVIVPPLKAQSGQSGKGDGAPLVFGPLGRGAYGTGRRSEDDPNLIAYPNPAYSVQGQGTRFSSGRHNQDTFMLAATLRSRQRSPGISLPGRGGEDDENIVLAQPVRCNPYNNSDPGMEATMHIVAGGVRRLTPMECERLQGFPDGWTAGFADSVRYGMLGNAICVPVAEWLGRRFLGCSEVPW